MFGRGNDLRHIIDVLVFDSAVRGDSRRKVPAAALDIPFDQTLEAHCASLNRRPTSIVKGTPKRQKWKEHNPEAVERILPMIRPLMKELGYDTDY